jgi:sec-independent protein translocase protein TatB
MPQIGWFEILIIVILAVLIIGPKDVPIIMKKIGNWIGLVKEYFNAVQEDLVDVENPFDEKTPVNRKTVNKENKNE